MLETARIEAAIIDKAIIDRRQVIFVSIVILFLCHIMGPNLLLSSCMMGPMLKFFSGGGKNYENGVWGKYMESCRHSKMEYLKAALFWRKKYL
jgi:hypothetical protein